MIFNEWRSIKSYLLLSFKNKISILGGFAFVYSVQDPNSGKEYAIKVNKYWLKLLDETNYYFETNNFMNFIYLV